MNEIAEFIEVVSGIGFEKRVGYEEKKYEYCDILITDLEGKEYTGVEALKRKNLKKIDYVELLFKMKDKVHYFDFDSFKEIEEAVKDFGFHISEVIFDAEKNSIHFIFLTTNEKKLKEMMKNEHTRKRQQN